MKIQDLPTNLRHVIVEVLRNDSISKPIKEKIVRKFLLTEVEVSNEPLKIEIVGEELNKFMSNKEKVDTGEHESNELDRGNDNDNY